MGLSLRWVGEDELDRVALTRTRCYALAEKELDAFKQGIRADGRAKPGDFLLVECDGQPIGTSTSLSLNMWVRGATIPFQGVAYVGTIKTHRRAGNAKRSGIATRIMHETLRKARERGDVLSALMPFRASFYEHFGYGMVERRAQWTIPLSIIPAGDFQGMRFMTSDDLPLIQACRERMVQRGQCDIERGPQAWAMFAAGWSNGYCVVDQPDPAGPIHSWMFLTERRDQTQAIVNVEDWAADSPDAFCRQCRFLGSLRDQCSHAIINTPIDLPLHWLLRETQVPHRPVAHPTAMMTQHTRMQVRILDHKRFLESLHLSGEPRGQVTLAVQETGASPSVFQAEFEGGRIAVKPASGSAQVQCPDRVWASIACGDLRASTAASLRLIHCGDPGAVELLDALAAGPAPFCSEPF